MPYELLNYRNGWRVCKTQEPDVCFSKKPLSLERAKKQKTAIEISERGGKKSLSSVSADRPVPNDPELYDRVKKEITERVPQHSLYRSALIVKEYKRRGGTYRDGQSRGITKWFKENWLSANDFLRGNKVKCGDNNAEKWDEYPLCYAEKRLKTFTKDELRNLIDKKTQLGQKHLPTKEITGKGKDKQLYHLYPSTLKTKKWDLYFERDGRQRKVSFGNPNYEDYTIHKDPERKRRYLARATKIKGNWANDPFSPNSLAINVLWNTPKSPQENLRLYLKKLNISS
jgi:hypothetical protein